MRLSEIKVNPKNPRIIKDEKFNRLKKSIQEFPKMMELRPMVIDNDNMVLGGNMRLKALEDLKYTDIPDNWIKKASELSEEEIRKFIILDNASFGEWDWDELANEYEVEELKDWGVEVPAFFGQNEAVEDDYEIPDEIETDIVLGDLFEIGQHRLLCGDARKMDEWERLGKKDGFVCFCSPPYNMSNNAKLVGNTHAAKRESLYVGNTDNEIDYDELLELSLQCAIYSCDGIAFNVQPLANNKIQLLNWISKNENSFNEIITWNKSQAQPAMAKGVCSAAYEWIVVFSKNNHTRAIPLSSWRGSLSNVYNAPPQRNNEYSEHHAATFPVHLPTYILTQLMNLSKGIIDCFMGTGTTMVAAHQLNRKCYGMEIDPKYCQVIIDRMLKLDPSLEIKKNGEIYQKTGIKQVEDAIS